MGRVTGALKTVLAVLLILALAPSSYGLWHETVNIEVLVTTGDFTCPRSKGYWIHQVRVHLEGHGQADIGEDELTAILYNVGNKSNVFDMDTGKRQVLENAYSILGGTGPRGSLEAQLLALWLNHEANYTRNYSIPLGNGTLLSAEDIIRISEAALASGDDVVYEEAKLLCESYNTMWSCE